MTTLQEQFEKDFPDKSVREINADGKYQYSNFTNRDLDLREYRNLKELELADNNLTFVDFLNQLPNPEKLELVGIYNNEIKPTDISFFSKFVNLRYLKIGTSEEGLKEGKHNKFYGSLKAYQNLTKLTSICIEATDVNEGLEYLPESLAKAIKAIESERGKYYSIECPPHNTNAKCKSIQDQLRDCLTMLFPSNSTIDDLSLADLKEQAQKVKEKNNKLQEKNQELKLALSEEQKANQELQKEINEKEQLLQDRSVQIQELKLTKSTIHQQTQTDFSVQGKRTQNEAKEAVASCKNNSTPLTEEEKK